MQYQKVKVHHYTVIIAILLIADLINATEIIGVVDSGNVNCTNSSTLSVKNLSNLQVKANNDITIKLCQRESILNGPLTIANKTDVTLIGFTTPSIILCQGGQLIFMSVHNLTMINVNFINCGMFHKGAICITDSFGLMLDDISVQNSTGSGLVLFNVGGTVTINDSVFNESRGGSGLSIEINKLNATRYTISQCEFHRNSAIEGSTHGGGINVNLFNTRNTEITIDGATFMNNDASDQGGGLSISFVKVSKDSTFLVANSQFVGNTADIGGGFSFRSTKTANIPKSVAIINCSFEENRAQFGSAIGIFPHFKSTMYGGYFSEVMFTNLIMDSNTITIRPIMSSAPFSQYEEGNGALYCSGYFTRFKGKSTVSNNNGSAFYMIQCSSEYEINSSITFVNNSGNYGGAIHLVSSVIIANNGTELKFHENTALSTGGALHFYSDEFSYSRYAKKMLHRNS